MTVSTLDEEGRSQFQFQFIAPSPSPGEVRARIQERNLDAGPRSTDHTEGLLTSCFPWLAQLTLIHHPRQPSPGVAPLTVSWVLPSQSSRQKTPPHSCPHASLVRDFLNLGLLFSDR